MDEDIEFEGIWKFHEDALVPDPGARVPLGKMYGAFVRDCTKSGRSVVDQDAFEFVFERLENPKPGAEPRGVDRVPAPHGHGADR